MPKKNVRHGGRAFDALRPVSFELGVNNFAEGSVLIGLGRTKVLCTASVEEEVPKFLEGKDKGWVTAEYGMLPRATEYRTNRERSGRGGRTAEIQRLIGRAMRGIVDLKALGPRTIYLDCDVLLADGGTRTAAITGAYVALRLAVKWLQKKKRITKNPLRSSVAAVSVGLVKGEPNLDLDYREDSSAEVDMNFVATGEGDFIEIQGTGEMRPFTPSEYAQLSELALKGIKELIAKQDQVLFGPGV